MAKTYQANHFTGQQLDDFMGKVLGKQFAGQGLTLDDQGILHATAPGYGKLVYSYTYASNKEVHPQGVNLTTGEFVAEAHGLVDNQKVFVAVNDPYHLIAPYNYIPGGLVLGTMAGGNSKYYYVRVVDTNTFSLSESAGGEAVTFAEVSTMDLSKFHIETYADTNLNMSNLPSMTELMVVIKGRFAKQCRYCIPGGRANTFGKNPIVGFDSSTTVDEYGSFWLGSRSGWGSITATVEMKFIGNRHVLSIATQDCMAFDTNNHPKAYHVRGYMHNYMNRDDIVAIHMQDLAFINGTTVEVYSK